MPPRAIWSGAISFGLVNVPVRMYSAIEEKDLHFHLLHVKDDSRIGYEKICKKEGKPVPDREGLITLERMYFADEIRPIDEIKPAKARLSSEELEMAATLIERFSGHFKPEKYKDTYRQELLKVIRAKQKGKDVHVEPPAEPEEVPDLLTALRASLEERKRAAPRKRAGARKSQRKAA